MNRPLPQTAAVLVSGGLDSAILSVDLLCDFQRSRPALHPVGATVGGRRAASPGPLPDAVARDGLEQLVILDEPIADVYGADWSTSGAGVPGQDTPDEAVYSPDAISCSRSRQRSGAGCTRLTPSPWARWARTPFPTAHPLFREARDGPEPGHGRHAPADPPVQPIAQDRRPVARQGTSPASDLLVYQPHARYSLRHVQQVRGTQEGLPRRRSRRRHGLSGVNGIVAIVLVL